MSVTGNKDGQQQNVARSGTGSEAGDSVILNDAKLYEVEAVDSVSSSVDAAGGGIFSSTQGLVQGDFGGDPVLADNTSGAYLPGVDVLDASAALTADESIQASRLEVDELSFSNPNVALNNSAEEPANNQTAGSVGQGASTAAVTGGVGSNGILQLQESDLAPLDEDGGEGMPDQDDSDVEDPNVSMADSEVERSDDGEPDVSIDTPLVDVDVPLDPVEELIGDIDLEVDVSGPTDPLGDLLGGDDSEPDISIDTPLVDVDVPLDPVEELVGDIDLEVDASGPTDPLGDLLGGDDSEPDISIDTPILDVDVPLDPVEELVGDIDLEVDVSGPTDPLGDLLGGDDSEPDISIDTPLVDVDVPLDPVEELVGDIDLEVDVSGPADPLGDLLGGDDSEPDISIDTPVVDVDVPLDPVEELVGDIDLEVDVSGPADPLGDLLGGDDSEPDISIDTPVVDVDVPLDPVEELVGDIDLEVDDPIEDLSINGELLEMTNDTSPLHDVASLDLAILDVAVSVDALVPVGVGELTDPAGDIGSGLGGLVGGFSDPPSSIF